MFYFILFHFVFLLKLFILKYSIAYFVCCFLFCKNSRTALRVFERETWDEIAAKLSLWKENTQSVIQVISNAGLTRFYQQMAARVPGVDQ